LQAIGELENIGELFSRYVAHEALKSCSVTLLLPNSDYDVYDLLFLNKLTF
jgi:hypothetical protein